MFKAKSFCLNSLLPNGGQLQFAFLRVAQPLPAIRITIKLTEK
ncbi:MAG TPA: hypothetical protein VI757_14560 [Bacteroidia bacterium]|nr:hypothetical protein [Bacteroidia bacterium]